MDIDVHLLTLPLLIFDWFNNNKAEIGKNLMNSMSTFFLAGKWFEVQQEWYLLEGCKKITLLHYISSHFPARKNGMET